MNILPIIKAWLDDHEFTDRNGDQVMDRSSPTREELRLWLEKKFTIDPALIDLAIDCLIAAGIGRESEQMTTVYCHCYRQVQ